MGRRIPSSAGGALAACKLAVVWFTRRGALPAPRCAFHLSGAPVLQTGPSTPSSSGRATHLRCKHAACCHESRNPLDPHGCASGRALRRARHRSGRSLLARRRRLYVSRWTGDGSAHAVPAVYSGSPAEAIPRPPPHCSYPVDLRGARLPLSRHRTAMLATCAITLLWLNWRDRVIWNARSLHCSLTVRAGSALPLASRSCACEIEEVVAKWGLNPDQLQPRAPKAAHPLSLFCACFHRWIMLLERCHSRGTRLDLLRSLGARHNQLVAGFAAIVAPSPRLSCHADGVGCAESLLQSQDHPSMIGETSPASLLRDFMPCAHCRF